MIVQCVTSNNQTALFSVTRIDSSVEMLNADPGLADVSSDLQASLPNESIDFSDAAVSKSAEVPKKVLALLRNSVADNPGSLEAAHAGLTLERVLDLIG